MKRKHGRLLIALFAAFVTVGVFIIVSTMNMTHEEMISAPTTPTSKPTHPVMPIHPPGHEIRVTPLPTPGIHLVDKKIDEMPFGSIAYNTPEHMNIDESSVIELVLSLTEPVEALRKYITEEGNITDAKIKVGDNMEATLTGEMFTITPHPPFIQSITTRKNARWSWTIHPKEEGVHEVVLTLTAHFTANGEDKTVELETYREPIEIEVTGRQKAEAFLDKHIEWLWTAIIAPIGLYIWRRVRRKNKQDTTD